ncbi:MAG: Ig domain-containing protein [Geobacteraceae bacterium]
MKIYERVVLAGLLAGVTVFLGCDSEKHPAGDGTGASGQLIRPQQHSGVLPVKILPDSPSSSDDLQAVFNDGGTVGVRWEKNGSILASEKTPRLAKQQFARGDTVTLTITSGGKTGKAIVSIANSLPEVRSARFTPEYICRGENVTAVTDGFDADADEVRFIYKWFINGDSIPQDSEVLQGDKINKGDRVSVIIVPQDNYGTGKPFKSQVISIPNASPWFISIPPTDFKGNMYSYAAKARDPDGDAITYSLVTFPEGMKIDSNNGMVTWPISATSAGSHTIEVAAQDSEGAKASQKYLLKIILPAKEVN